MSVQMTRAIDRLLASVLTAGLLAGVATAGWAQNPYGGWAQNPYNLLYVPLDREAAARLHSIVVVGPADAGPTENFLYYHLESRSDDLWILRGIGDVPAPAVRRSSPRQSEDFNRAMMHEAALHLGSDIQAAVAAALARDGFNVSTAKIKTDPNAGLDPAELANIKADAVLGGSLAGVMGYTDDFDGGDFRPSFKLTVALTDVKSQRVLFRQGFYYDAYATVSRHIKVPAVNGKTIELRENNSPNFVFLRPDPRFHFPDYEAVLADPALAAEGLRAAAPLVADKIGEMLKRPYCKPISILLHFCLEP